MWSSSLGFVFLAIFLSFSPSKSSAQSQGTIFQAYSKPMPAPDFSLQDLNGKRWDLAKLRGEVVLINFWATWCPPCRKEGPSFDKLYAQWRSDGLSLLRVDTKENRETILKFLEKNPVKVPVLLDADGRVGRLFGLWAHPTSYLIDRRGMVRYRSVGAVDWTGSQARSVIQALLKEE